MILASWDRVRFGDILSPVSRPEHVEPDRLYRVLGAHWYAQGLYVKEVKTGSEIQADRLYRVHRGDLVYNRLFAWKGSFAVAESEQAGCYVSGEFPCFQVDPDKIDAGFLWRYLSQARVWEQALGLSTGGTPTSRNRLKEDRFLAMETPLPPLGEQRRIVARIEELAARIEEARGLRREATESAGQLIPSVLHHAFETQATNWKRIPMWEAIEVSDRQVDPMLPEFARLPHISGENIESKTCRLLSYRTAEQDGVRSGNYHFSPGTVLYSKIRPYLRKAVLVDFEGVCSADVYPLRVISSQLNPKFMMWSLVAGPFANYANRLSGRTRMPKLNRKQLFGFNVAYPDMQEQHRIVTYLDDLQARADALKRLQVETAVELDALLPSVLDKAFRGEL